MLDLYHATRDDLIGIIREQREALADRDRQLATLAAELAELRRVLTELTAQLGAVPEPGPDGDPPHGTKGMPGLKAAEPDRRAPRPRKRRGQGFGRHRMPATDRVVHALAACPDCGAPLAGGTVKRTREVIELPRRQIVVTEHVYLERRCPDCGKRCVPGRDLDGMVSGRRRLGHGLTSLIAVLREEARLPFGTIQRLLATLTGLHLSVGALVDTVGQVADRVQPVVAHLTAAIRARPVVHADETGWRENGHNGYVWTFSTPEGRVFVRGSRAKGMVTDVLGEQFAGILVSDFYTAYTGDHGLHQYCWAHLVRDIRMLTEQHPDDPALRGWAAAVGTVLTRAQAGATDSQAQRWRVRKQAEADLKRLCEPWLEPRVAQTPLCARILRYLESLFVFVTEPGVPPTNNAAERSLRHLVVRRKISGGTRSARGTATTMTLASLFGTWRVQGINPYVACRDLLASPQV
jgi:transposase